MRILRRWTVLALPLVACSGGSSIDVPEIGEQAQALVGLTVQSSVNQGGYIGDLVTWRDRAGRNRSAFLVKNDALDPGGTYGGYIRSFSYAPTATTTRTATSTPLAPGFGSVSTQRSSDYLIFSSLYTQGTRTVRTSGPNHFVVEYSYPNLKAQNGTVAPVRATAQWTFTAGRDNPVYAVTYDSSAAAANALDMTANAPFGSLEFTGAGADAVDGVGWGDRRKFRTTSAGPVSFNSAWDYTQTNLVPYVHEWNDAKNAEMGVVQTQRTTVHDAGYGYFFTNWGRTSANRIIDGGTPASQLMPANWNWTYTLNQWSLPANPAAKTLGWGSNYGGVGKTAAAAYGGGTYSGYPYQSYSVHVVLGAKGAVDNQATEVERFTAATLVATKGTVAASGPGGAGRTDTVAYAPAGYNHVVGTWDLVAEAGTGAVAATFDPKGVAITNPTFRVLGFAAGLPTPTTLLIGGVTGQDGTDFDLSRDGTTLWITLRRTLSAATTLSLNAAPPPPPPTWAPIAVDNATSVGGYVSDVYRWRDSGNKERTTALVHNDVADPAGLFGGYVRRFSYAKGDGSTRTALGGHTVGHPGWGYTVHHQASGLDRETLSSRRAPGTYRRIIAGPHHTIHEFSWNVLRTQGEPPAFPQVDKNIKVTIQYLFVTGRDNPLWTATIDTSGYAANAFSSDDRGPYGELAFDGSDGVVSGAFWGDRYKFRTTSAPLSMGSAWDYSQTNRVPYTGLWSDPENAEMGAVQTVDWQRKDAGTGWLYPNWGRTSANKVITAGTPASPVMPLEWNWTYQLNQWQLPFDPNAKFIAWGTNQGSVGRASYPAYGDDRNLSGYPYTTRSVYMVLGAKGAAAVQTSQVERHLDAVLTAYEGTLATSGPKGVGTATAVSEPFPTPGYNPVYGVFEASAVANKLRVNVDPRGGALANPTFRIRNYTVAAPVTIRFGAATLTENTDYVSSRVNGLTGDEELWLTFLSPITTAAELAINTVPAGPGSSYQHFDINHVLSTGQSNAASAGTPPLTSTQPYGNRMFNPGVFTSVSCSGEGCTGYVTPSSLIPLVESDGMLGAPAETIASGLANEATKLGREIYLLGRPAPQNDHIVLASAHPRSGNGYECLRKGGCSYQNASWLRAFTEGMNQVTDGKRLATAAGLSYVVRGVTVIHGESNHYWQEFPISGSDGTPNKIQNYADALVEWQADYESSIKAITGQTIAVPLFVSQMSNWSGSPQTYSPIPINQLAAHTRAPGKVVVVTPSYIFPYKTDGLHFTNAGQRRLGEYFGKAYAKMVFTGQPWEPVRPSLVTRSGNVITATFVVPVPPLALDTTQVVNPGNFGFEYTDASGAAPAITGVAVSGPDTVTITLASAPTGSNKRLRYAYTSVPGTPAGPTAGPRGNLRDSDATPSQYGYPLQNWSVHFDTAVP